VKTLNEIDRKHIEAAGAWVYLGNAIEADKELDEITAEMREHPTVLTVRLEVHMKLEKWESAIHIVQALLTVKRDQINYWIRKAQILDKLGRFVEAKKTIKEALDSKTWGPDDLFDIAIESQKLNWPDEAFECIRAGIDKSGFQQLKALALELAVLKPIHARIQALE